MYQYNQPNMQPPPTTNGGQVSNLQNAYQQQQQQPQTAQFQPSSYVQQQQQYSQPPQQSNANEYQQQHPAVQQLHLQQNQQQRLQTKQPSAQQLQTTLPNNVAGGEYLSLLPSQTVDSKPSETCHPHSQQFPPQQPNQYQQGQQQPNPTSYQQQQATSQVRSSPPHTAQYQTHQPDNVQAYYQQQQNLQQQNLQQQATYSQTNAQNTYGQPVNQYANAYAQQQQQYSNQPMDQLSGNMAGMTLTHGFNRMLGNEGFNLLSERNVKSKIKIQRNAFNLNDLIRCTMSKVPESTSILQKSRLPFGLLLHPFKDVDIPVVQDRTIVRCRSCRTYINPFVRILEQRRWQCNLCHRLNDLPDDFLIDPRTKNYLEYPLSQPELTSGSVEFIASVDYMIRPPQAAAYLFVFDCSTHAYALGYVPVMAKIICENLENIPGDSRTLIGFIGFDSNIHFFNLGDIQPTHMVVPDIQDTFIPCPENLLVQLSRNADNVERFLTDILPNLPQESITDSGSALGSALSIAYKLLSSLGGRITVFQAALPNIGGNDGSVLKNREDPNNRAVQASSTQALTPLLNPVTDFYKKLALECSEHHVAVDIFNLCPTYSDIASVGQVAKISGGSIFYYGNSGFNMRCSPDRVLARFESDLEHYLCRDIGFEAVMRMRCTRGLSIHTFHGNFFVRSTDLLALPNCNPDSGYAIQISIDEELKDFSNACFQAAVLYTNANGERRIRVHTISLPVVATINEIVSNADQEAIVGLLVKMATDRTLTDNLADAREALINCAVDLLQTYKTLNPMESMNGLVASQATALLPLYISAILKHPAFRVGISTKIDDRVYALEKMKTLPLSDLLIYIYPNLYPLHREFDYGKQEWPASLQLSFGNIERHGAYLLDTYDTLILYVCKAVSTEFLQNVFAVNHFAQIPDDGDNFPPDLSASTNTNQNKPGQTSLIPKPSTIIHLENYDNQLSNQIHALIYHLVNSRPFKPHFFIIREDSRAKFIFLQNMFDDRSESAFSYFEFLQHIQQQIKN